jgi:hypothetical protein
MNFRRLKRGITSLDVLFLLVVLLGIAGVSAWILRGTYCQGNEMSAIAVLRMISQAEESFHEQNRRYASLKELSTPASDGAAPFRSSLPPQIAKDTPFEGYFFQVFQSEPGAGPIVPQDWCAYAWPVSYGLTGFRSFLIDHSGKVCAARVQELGGKDPKKWDPAIAYKGGKLFGEVSWRPIGEGEP